MTLLQLRLHIDGSLLDLSGIVSAFREMLRQGRGISQWGHLRGVFFDRVHLSGVLTAGEMADRLAG